MIKAHVAALAGLWLAGFGDRKGVAGMAGIASSGAEF
jgi:hypothetical protein